MIYIWIRRTCDWSDEQAFLHQLEPDFEPLLEVWNETFEMPYHLFRARVFEIAQANLAEVRGAQVAEWDQIPEGALVLPTDDDDWFAPHIAEKLELVRRPGTEAYLWIPTWAEIPMWFGHRLYLVRQFLFPWTPPKWRCSTNNYAMVKRAGTLALLDEHMQASAWAKAAADGLVLTLRDRLSMVNRSIASHTQLRAGDRSHPSTRAEMLRKLARYRRRYRRIDLSKTPWAEPYVAQMAALTAELQPRG
jgi:hypothetical protein